MSSTAPTWARRGMLPALMLVLCVAGIRARAAEPLRIREESRIKLEGTTTLTDWSCVGTLPEGRIDLGLRIAEIEDLLDRVLTEGTLSPQAKDEMRRWADKHVQADVRLAVMGLDCGNRAMERDLEEALEAQRHPTVSYTFIHLAEVSLSHDRDTRELILHTQGILELAGVGREIVMDVLVSRGADGCVVARSTTRVNMTDFGVDPPVALFGLIRARDPVDIVFTLHVGPDSRVAATQGR